MDNLLSLLLANYGVLPLGLAVIIGIIIVWLLAHFNAAPGGNVSVLWGLVQYIKSESKSVSLFSGNTHVLDANIDGEINKLLQTLRTQRQLRALQLLESGRKLSETARGTYFFVNLVFLRKQFDEKALDLGDAPVEQSKIFDTLC